MIPKRQKLLLWLKKYGKIFECPTLKATFVTVYTVFRDSDIYGKRG